MREWFRQVFTRSIHSPPPNIRRTGRGGYATRSFVIKCVNCQEELGIITVAGDPLEEGVARSGAWSAEHIFRCGSCLATKLGNTYSRPVA